MRRQRIYIVPKRPNDVLDETILDEEEVGELRARVKTVGGHGLALFVDLSGVGEFDGGRSSLVQGGRDGDDTWGASVGEFGCFMDEGKEAVGQKEVPKVVHGKMAVYPVGGHVIFVDAHSRTVDKLK